MTPNRIILFLGTALFLTLSAAPSGAQIIERRTTTSDATTIEALLKRIDALENAVAQLRQQTAFIKSVNPLVFEAPGAAITIRGSQISLEAMTGFDVRAGSNMSIRAGGAMTIDAAAGLDLKGSVVKLNGGSRPVACAGGITNVLNASGAVPFSACGATVLVPQN